MVIELVAQESFESRALKKGKNGLDMKQDGTLEMESTVEDVEWEEEGKMEGWEEV